METYDMGFEPQKKPLYFKDDNDNECVSPENMQMVNGDTGLPMGVVGNNYRNTYYREAFSLLEPIVENGATIVAGGAPNNGERGYLVMEAPGTLRISGKEDIVNRFVALSSHDGSKKIEIHMTPTYKGVALTFDAGHPIAFKHTKNVVNKIAAARRTFRNVNEKWAEFSSAAQKMMGTSITDQDTRDFIELVLPDKKGVSPTRTENMREHIYDIVKTTGIGTKLPKCRGTVFGVVMGFAEWADLHRTVRKSKKRDEKATKLDRDLISEGAKKKAKAWALAMYLATNKSLQGASVGSK
jgi:phage/plasmid-like protein (TIGR03299 family)